LEDLLAHADLPPAVLLKLASALPALAGKVAALVELVEDATPPPPPVKRRQAPRHRGPAPDGSTSRPTWGDWTQAAGEE
jgi:hypothetical protein